MAERPGTRLPPGTLSRQVTLAVLTLAGLIVQRFPLPWGLVSILFLLPAGVLAIRLLRTLLRARVGGFAVLGVGLTLGIVVISLLGSLLTAIVYPTMSTFQQCTARAITESAAQECRDQLNQRTQNLLGG